MAHHRFRFYSLLAICFLAGSLFTAQLTKMTTTHAQSKRVFELRTYHTLPGRLPALQALFRNHTTKLFEKHGMTNVGYWTPQDASVSENTLIYILAHERRDAAKKSWAAFRSDPDWQAVSKASEADGKIVEKVESVFMDPTDYSSMK